MALLAMQPDWTLRLTTAEFRLVLKALGGRLKTEEIGEAAALGDRITMMRAQTTRHVMQEADKLLANLTPE